MTDEKLKSLLENAKLIENGESVFLFHLPSSQIEPFLNLEISHSSIFQPSPSEYVMIQSVAAVADSPKEALKILAKAYVELALKNEIICRFPVVVDIKPSAGTYTAFTGFGAKKNPHFEVSPPAYMIS